MAFKGGVVLGTVSFNATGAGTTAINATSGTGTVSIGNTSSAAVTIDCGTAGITVGTTANNHASTFGSLSGTSSTTLQSGSGALNVTSTNGALTINSGTGAYGLSTDASATTMSIGTGGAVKAITLGSTNTTSSLALKSGSGNIIANSGLTIDSTGRNYNTAQPAFMAFLGSSVNNVTGTGTLFKLGTTTALTEDYDQGNNFNTNGTFTAPITGKYYLQMSARVTGCTIAQILTIQIVTTQRTFNYVNGRPANANDLGGCLSVCAQMTAGDTAIFNVGTTGEAGDTDDIVGSTTTMHTFVSGYLAC